MIVDLDAHQGNGHERDHLGDKDTYIMDAYNHNIYPGDVVAKNAISYDIPVHRSTTDSSYMKQLDKALTEAIQQFQPEFVVYNAGTDCLINDPLGDLGITAKGIC